MIKPDMVKCYFNIVTGVVDSENFCYLYHTMRSYQRFDVE